MRIVLSTFGTLGDILPFARLASALINRGHTVSIHSWEHYRAWFPPRAAFVPAGGGIVEAEFQQTFEWALRAPSFLEQVRRFARLFYGLGDGTTRAREYFNCACAAFAPHDLALIHVLDHVGQAAAERIELPWVCFSTRPPSDAALADSYYAEIDGEVEKLVSEVAATPRRVRIFREQSPILTLAACSPQLAPSSSADVQSTGAWLDAPRLEPVSLQINNFLDDGPALLVTFGTMPDVNGRTAATIEAVARSGWRAIVQVLAPVLAPAAVPEGILVVGERLPFASVLPRVAAVVHHGSLGTAHEIVRAGRPSLVIPHMADQYFWAETLHDHGLGPAPIDQHDLLGDTFAAAISALRDAANARRASDMGRRLAVEDGLAVAVESLEAVANAV